MSEHPNARYRRLFAHSLYGYRATTLSRVEQDGVDAVVDAVRSDIAPASQPSPLAQAEDAKARRDLGGEIGALMAADAELAAQPWAPLQPGDVVLSYLPARGDVPAYGQTFLAVKGERDISGHALLREVSATPLPDEEDDEVADECDGAGDEPDKQPEEWSRLAELTPFYDLWFEAGPAGLVVIRAGAVVHGQPAGAAQ